MSNIKDVPMVMVLLCYFSLNGAWHTDICKDSHMKFLRLIGYQIFLLSVGLCSHSEGEQELTATTQKLISIN